MPTLYRPYLSNGYVYVPEALFDGFYESARHKFGYKFSYTQSGSDFLISDIPEAICLKIARAEYNIFDGYDDHREDIPVAVVDLINDAGCYADGVHDDTAAIAAAFVSAGHKGVVYAPPGLYLVTSKIAIETMFAKFYGHGLASQFYMTGNDTLFSLNESGATAWQWQRISDIALYSNAEATDSACLKMHRVHDAYIDGLIVRGSDKAIYMSRVLRNRFIGCASNRGYLSFDTSTPNTWVYADEAEGTEANENKFVECNFCGSAAYGYFLKNGQFSIRGGCCEGVSVTGIYIYSCNKFSIYDNHSEGSGENGIHIVSTPCGDISSVYTDRFVKLESCSDISIHHSYVSGIDVQGSRNCSVHHNKIGSRGLIKEEDTECYGNTYASGTAFDPPGFAYASPHNLLSNDDLEDWTTGLPDGFTDYKATIAQETTTKRSGSSSAKITANSENSMHGIYWPIATAKYSRISNATANTKSITVSGYFYRPSSGGNIVSINLANRDGSGLRYHTPVYFDIATDTWVKCTATFNLQKTPVTNVWVIWGMYGSVNGKICYVDDLSIHEGKATFQDDLLN